MNISKTIWTIRKKSGMTQVQFAERIGITQTYLSDIERGLKNPSDEMLEKIASNLGLTAFVIKSMSIEEKDVPENKKDAFMMIKDSLKGLAEEIINESIKNK